MGLKIIANAEGVRAQILKDVECGDELSSLEVPEIVADVANSIEKLYGKDNAKLEMKNFKKWTTAQPCPYKPKLSSTTSNPMLNSALVMK